MTGQYDVSIYNRRLKFEFTIRRNITLIRGDSATGKSTLIKMLDNYEENGIASGITLICQKKCVVLDSVRWQVNLQAITDSIVFIEEGDSFVKSDEFSLAVKESDNYFVIITRDNLPNLPYSVKEIYGIRVSQKYAGLKQLYNEFYPLYDNQGEKYQADNSAIIIEDGKAGFEFFSEAYGKEHNCVSANGKSNIYKLLLNLCDDNTVVRVVADGAAFGAEIERICQLAEDGRKIILFLPESFEWLLLKANLMEDSSIDKILAEPIEHIDSKKYISWERFFTDLLIEKTEGTYWQYSKQSLNPVYLHEKNMQEIMSIIHQL